MTQFYLALAGAAPNAKNMVKTVIDGAHLGEKALFSDGVLTAQSVPGGFFSQHASSAESCGIYEEIAGETIFCEALGREKTFVVCGGGHVSMPIVRLGRMIGCHVIVLEDRPSFADNARAAGADRVICDSFTNALAQIEGDADTYFIIVTRGHRYDMDCLRAVLRKPHAYIGMMGSRRRVGIIRQQLLAEGFDPALIDAVRAPIGLSIGAETPEEIAVAILAEIIEIKNKAGGTSGWTPEILKAILNTPDTQPGVLATIVRKKGAAPRKPGTRMLILPSTLR